MDGGADPLGGSVVGMVDQSQLPAGFTAQTDTAAQSFLSSTAKAGKPQQATENSQLVGSLMEKNTAVGDSTIQRQQVSQIQPSGYEAAYIPTRPTVGLEDSIMTSNQG